MTALGMIAIVALVLMNAYFVATEFALVAVRNTQIDLWVAEGRRGANAAAAATGRLDDAIDRGIDPDALLDLIKVSGFTRIPVYEGSFDNVIGILHTKDLFAVYADRRVVILEDAIRPATFMRGDLQVVDALRQFRRGRRHLMIVRNGDGPVLGVCTLEDVLEEIVGEIEDEHDEPTPAGSD